MSFFINLPRYVYLYFFCQSINLMAAVMSVTVAAIIGNKIASDPLYATVPYGMQFVLLLIATYPASVFMNRYGRKPVFVAGAVFLLCSGVIGYAAVANGSFFLLIIAHSCIGVFTACANFYRYAVTDGLAESLHSKALSLVVSGGVIAGILGPTASNWLQDVPGFPNFALCYAFFIILAVINVGIIYYLPDIHANIKDTLIKSKTALVTYRDVVFAAICTAAFGYGLMNLLMIQSSLKMDVLHIAFEDTAMAIQWHVVAMFFPSFFTGALIARCGHFSIIFLGFMLFVASFALNIYDVTYLHIFSSLILLGLGWNFTYVGGSSLLASCLAHHSDAKKWQGIGDTAIAVCATIGAILPSFLLSGVGWENSNLLAMGVCIALILGLIGVKIKMKIQNNVSDF